MTAFAVVGTGRVRRLWPRIAEELEQIFPQLAVAQCDTPGAVARLVRDALKDGYLEIVAVGGDGLLNAALNGFFEDGVAVSPDAVLAFVAEGDHCDMARSLGIAPGYAEGLAFLRRARIRKADIGFVQCLDNEAQPTYRYFLGAASFGFMAALARRVNMARLARLFGKRFAVAWSRLTLRAKSCRVRLMADTGHDEIVGVSSVAIANGSTFGDGLTVAPGASLQDGQFDVVMMGRSMASPARGFRASRVTAAPVLETVGPVRVECDGEQAGLLPATFAILPGAINLRC